MSPNFYLVFIFTTHIFSSLVNGWSVRARDVCPINQKNKARQQFLGIEALLKLESQSNKDTSELEPQALDPMLMFSMPLCHGFKLEEATIDQLQERMHNGQLSSVQIIQCYVERYHQVNGRIRAIMEINPDVFTIAENLDEERLAGKIRGPLHGIPFLVKDNFATKDKMETTAGSLALLGSKVPRDAHVVSKLRSAGAILMGKATMSEWADMRSNIYSEGYSARGGQGRSPYNLTSSPGGSSSGSAIAVAANLATFSLGTETDGSIISPADRNAIVGIKPTVGLTSRSGVVPISRHQDTVGCFARTVRDAVYVLDNMQGMDITDIYTMAQQERVSNKGNLQFCQNKHVLVNATFGLPWKSFWIFARDEVKVQLLELIELMKGSGATIINETEIPSHRDIVSSGGWDWDYGNKRGRSNESEYTVIKSDFYNDIESYLSELENTTIRTLEDIVQFNFKNDKEEGGTPNTHRAFMSGQDGFLASLESQGIRDQNYYEALSFCSRKTREEGIDAALKYQGIDLDGLLVPSNVAQAAQIAAQAGYPMISIPVSIDKHGMPFGLSIMNTAWSEPTLVKYASAIEDLQISTKSMLRRTLPNWYEHETTIIPVV